MADLVLEPATILATFDDLVQQGTIQYGSEELSTTQDNGFDFEFRVCPAFLTKPGVPGSQSGDDEKSTFGPGSDIFVPDSRLKTAAVCNTHVLAFNRFCVFRPQYLLLTADSYRRQTELLDASDLKAAWAVLEALQTEHFAIYNCGPVAGCSRLHKHLQIFPASPDFTLFPDRADLDLDRVPFRFFWSRFEARDLSQSEGRARLYGVYQRLVVEAQAALDARQPSRDYFPHNVVLTRRWIVVIPRCKQTFHDLSANAAGMCGMVWTATREQVTRWREEGPTRVLSELGLGK